MKFEVGDIVEYKADGTTAKIIGIHNKERNQYKVSLYQGEVTSRLGENVLKEKCKHHTGVYSDKKEKWICPFC